MPACAKCNRVGATAEFRRRPKRPGEWACKDATSCGRRVSSARLEAKATKLSQRNRRRIELALEQLEAAGADLGMAFTHTDALKPVFQAAELIAGYLNPKSQETTDA